MLINPNISFGSRLADRRKAAGLTQEQLGEGLAADGGNVGKGAISSWEVGRTAPSAAQIPKICERLGCSADDLLGMRTVAPKRTPTNHPGQRITDKPKAKARG